MAETRLLRLAAMIVAIIAAGAAAAADTEGDRSAIYDQLRPFALETADVQAGVPSVDVDLAHPAKLGTALEASPAITVDVSTIRPSTGVAKSESATSPDPRSSRPPVVSVQTVVPKVRLARSGIATKPITVRPPSPLTINVRPKKQRTRPVHQLMPLIRSKTRTISLQTSPMKRPKLQTLNTPKVNLHTSTLPSGTWVSAGELEPTSIPAIHTDLSPVTTTAVPDVTAPQLTTQTTTIVQLDTLQPPVEPPTRAEPVLRPSSSFMVLSGAAPVDTTGIRHASTPSVSAQAAPTELHMRDIRSPAQYEPIEISTVTPPAVSSQISLAEPPAYATFAAIPPSFVVTTPDGRSVAALLPAPSSTTLNLLIPAAIEPPDMAASIAKAIGVAIDTPLPLVVAVPTPKTQSLTWSGRFVAPPIRLDSPHDAVLAQAIAETIEEMLSADRDGASENTTKSFVLHLGQSANHAVAMEKLPDVLARVSGTTASSTEQARQLFGYLESNEMAAHIPRYAALLAEYNFDRARYPTALACLERIPAAERSPKILHIHAQCLFRTDRADDALPIYLDLVENSPDSEYTPPARFMIAVTYIRSQRPALARPHLEAIITHHPTTPYAPRAQALLDTLK